MEIKLDFENKVLCNKLNEYFNNNIKFSINISNKVLINTKIDLFYEIDIYSEKIPLFVLNNDNSIIESMIVEELCNKRIESLTSGYIHYIVRTIDNEFFFKGKNEFEVNKVLNDLNIIDIKCGAFHTLVLTSSGEVYAWGVNSMGQIGIDYLDENLTPAKVIGFECEKIHMISCGYQHSLALTVGGRVFSWGNNEFGQLGIEGIPKSYEPKHIELEDLIINKISCGRNHSLLLSKEGVIYTFGDNSYGQLGNRNEEKQSIPVKINHKNKFIDIASHFNEDISASLSSKGIFYIWGKCKDETILTPMKTIYNSFANLFDNFVNNPNEYRQSDKHLNFNDFIFRTGYYKKKFKELETLGSGSFGTVVKVVDKWEKSYAIKKIEPLTNYENEFVNEFITNSVIGYCQNDYIIFHYNAWFEIYDNISSENILLFIQMHLCHKTLEDLIDEINNDPNFERNETLTPIGYYIASELFIEILKGVLYLHDNNIIHRDLKPMNILLKKSVKIADFGLATLHKFSKQPHSKDKGTPKYTAPEVINSDKYDIKADIYSLGIILAQLFDIGINSALEDYSIESYFLITKYAKLIEVCVEMTSDDPSKRPNCKEILEKRIFWALDLNELEIENELRDILCCPIKNANFYIYSILELKLRKYFEKQNSTIKDAEEKMEKVDDMIDEIDFKDLSESKLIETMHRFENGPFLFLKSLYHLNFLMRNNFQLQDILNHLIVPIRKHSKILFIQLVSLDIFYFFVYSHYEEYSNSGISENSGSEIEENAESVIDENFYSKLIDNQVERKIDESKSSYNGSSYLESEDSPISETDENLSSKISQTINNRISGEIDKEILEKIVEVTIEAMESFPNHKKLQKKSLSLLSNEHIINNVSFDRFKCFRLALDSMVKFKDSKLNLEAVSICSRLSLNLTGENKLNLISKPAYMESLLNLVRSCLQSVDAFDLDPNNVLEQTLYTLSYIVESSAENCKIFIEKDGIKLYLSILNKYFGQSKFEIDEKNNVLSIFNNISEFSELKDYLMETELLSALRNLTQSSEMHVSYFATGTLANLCSYGVNRWSNTSIDFITISSEIENAVTKWKKSKKEFVIYRNFLPLRHLLECFESLSVQLYVVWTIHFLCCKNAKFYCEKLMEINGYILIIKIYNKSKEDKNTLLMSLCEQILDLVENEYSNTLAEKPNSKWENLTEITEDSQIYEPLLLHEHNPYLVQKNLLDLYNYSISYCETKINLIDSIVKIMKKYPDFIDIQVISIACLGIFLEKSIQTSNVDMVEEIVGLILKAMELFSSHLLLQMNSLLALINILWNQEIVKFVPFDKFKCMQLAMDSMVLFNDTEMNDMAVEICSILSNELSIIDKTKFFIKPAYIERLLEIVRNCILLESNYFILKYSMEILSNLSDFSPKVCQLVLLKDGINLFLSVLNKNFGENVVVELVLNLFYNIASISHLRNNLMKFELLSIMRILLQSPRFNVSHITAGIFAHLCSDGIKSWCISSIDYNSILYAIFKRVSEWKISLVINVLKVSISSLVPLLNCFEAPAVQLWAVWTIYFFLSNHFERYFQIIKENNVFESLKQIYDKSKSSKNVEIKSLCERIIALGDTTWNEMRETPTKKQKTC